MLSVAHNFEPNVSLPWVFHDALGGDFALLMDAVDGLGLSMDLTPMNLYVLGNFTWDALAAAGIEPKLYHMLALSGRYSTHVVDGKEILGVEEWVSASSIPPGYEVKWLSVEKIGRALSAWLQTTSVRDKWPDAARHTLSLYPPLFNVEPAPQTPPRPAPPPRLA